MHAWDMKKLWLHPPTSLSANRARPQPSSERAACPFLKGQADGDNGDTAMQRQPGFLEVMALVCTVIAAVLAIADWMLKMSIV
jgi:hypothetical protein